MYHRPLSEKVEALAKQVVDAAFRVHQGLEPGLLESVYEVCFCHELRKRRIQFRRQVPLPVRYDGIIFEEGYRLDVLAENLIVCEFKAVESLLPVHYAQVLTYLRLSGKRLGFLINFNSAIIRNGIHRLIL
jgi:GxxExxY protein